MQRITLDSMNYLLFCCVTAEVKTTTTTRKTTFIYITRKKIKDKVIHQIEPYKYGISCL